jgi:hypothetical protein
MATVDVEDDSIRRFVVRHYRYYSDRHERRHVVVAAFDNEAEFEALLAAITADIQRRRAMGEPTHLREHASGVVYEPGDRQRAAAGHLLRRMTEHGVSPRSTEGVPDLPPSIAFLGPD